MAADPTQPTPQVQPTPAAASLPASTMPVPPTTPTAPTTPAIPATPTMPAVPGTPTAPAAVAVPPLQTEPSPLNQTTASNVPLTVNIPAQTIQKPTTQQDTNSLIQQNHQIAQASAIQPVFSYEDAVQRLNQAKAALNNYESSIEAGQLGIMNRIEPLSEQQGQQAALTRDTGFVHDALARSVDAYSGYVQAAQAQRDFELRKQQMDFERQQAQLNYNLELQRLHQPDYQLSYDPDTGKPMVFNSKTGQMGVASLGQYQDGSVGGQCAVFAEKIANFGTPGNTLGNNLKDKQATVNKYGINASQWRQQGPQVGDGIIFNIGQYGHVSVVTGVNGDGTVTVKDSNYGLDGKVQTRTVSMSDPKIYGVLRGQLKTQPGTTTKSNNVVTNAGLQTAQNIINSSNSWGDAAAKLEQRFGQGGATQFDSQLKTKFQIPSDLVSVSQQAAQHGQAPHTWTLNQWQQNYNQFVQDHSYNPDAAKKAFEDAFPKPTASQNKPNVFKNIWHGIGNFFNSL